jgi:hypothetical protein
MTLKELKHHNWTMLITYFNNGDYKYVACNNAYIRKTESGIFRYLIKKNSIEYDKLIGIRKWKKINIGTWYIKDLKIIQNKLYFNRNDLKE